MICRFAALILGMSISLWAHADNWLGEYVFVPNERMPQLYDEQGKELTIVTVMPLQEGLGININFAGNQIVPVKLETDGNALRDWLGDSAKNISSQALVGERIALIRIAKGSTVELENGRSHTMRSDYLLLMPGADLELEKTPSTP